MSLVISDLLDANFLNVLSEKKNINKIKSKYPKKKKVLPASSEIHEPNISCPVLAISPSP